MEDELKNSKLKTNSKNSKWKTIKNSSKWKTTKQIKTEDDQKQQQNGR